MIATFMSLRGGRGHCRCICVDMVIGDYSEVNGTNGQFIPSNVLLHGNNLTEVSLTERLENSSLVLVPPELFYTL